MKNQKKLQADLAERRTGEQASTIAIVAKEWPSVRYSSLARWRLGERARVTVLPNMECSVNNENIAIPQVVLMCKTIHRCMSTHKSTEFLNI